MKRHGEVLMASWLAEKAAEKGVHGALVRYAVVPVDGTYVFKATLEAKVHDDPSGHEAVRPSRRSMTPMGYGYGPTRYAAILQLFHEMLFAWGIPEPERLELRRKEKV